jgi:outer membrane protein assembly factor BamB
VFDPRKRSQLIIWHAFLFLMFFPLCGIATAAPSITLSKRSGPPTSRIGVSGRGFEPNVGVDIYFGTKDEALVVTNDKGEFRNAGIGAPRSARPGEHWVTALERNNDKGAQKPFLIQTDWSQFRFSPEHNAANPFENVLNPHTVGGLGVKWIYNTQNLYAWGSPIVVAGMAYVATWDGLYKLDANTGALRWKFSLFPELLSSDPAVANGILYIGTFDEGIYALDADTGVTLWSNACGRGYCRVFSSPAVANGMVYFDDAEDNSGDGVYALDAKTGKLLWFSPTNSSFSSPAVANGVVYVGSDDSNLYALDAFTGVKLWSYATGWVVRTSPAVANGVVYFGSDDKNVYALNATTGAKLWSYATNGYVEGSPAVANGVVYFGSDDGNLYALNAYTGDLLWSYATGNYVYNPTIANGVVYVGSAYPDAVYALNATTGTLLWSYATGGWVASDPAVVNGVVYISSYNDGLIYAFNRAEKENGKVDQMWSASKRPDLKTLRPDFSLKVSKPVATPRRGTDSRGFWR